ncbi:alpha/beta hydrolase [Methanolacinia petrolearia]|uniref:alpha/beta hydrolase n=1 Tax=Methanolacinia petrolearia TaxID=54120 RepID=UPI003BA86C39
MDKEYIKIDNNEIAIPAVLWGKSDHRLLIEVHGNCSGKEGTVIEMIAQTAVSAGYRALSFDLPTHGERQGDNYECNPENCVSDLKAAYDYAETIPSEISLFACNIGAYFSLLAYHNLDLEQSLFLFPIVNMERLIENMMKNNGISEERLNIEGRIQLPDGQALDINYYRYVKDNPVSFEWKSPTSILYGSKDDLSEWKEISGFSSRYKAPVTVLEGGEHFFHTDEQLRAFDSWAKEDLGGSAGYPSR